MNRYDGDHSSVSSSRKVHRDQSSCPVQLDGDGVWQLREYHAARALLRSPDTVQAGLGIEFMDKVPSSIRRPVLYRDGVEHRDNRRRTARFFTPRHVDQRYRRLMHDIADREVAMLHRAGRADLASMSFRVSVDVAKQVVGLTNSRPGTAERLERFFVNREVVPGFNSPGAVGEMIKQLTWWAALYLKDVRPAVRARRKKSRDDVISHMIGEGRNGIEILAECLTFAAAGMVTTKELMNVAAWHFLTDEDLRKRYREGAEAVRYEILHEILRLEPPVDTLKRRTTQRIDLPDGTSIPKGALVCVTPSAANTDSEAAGSEPLSLIPGREISAGLSFSEGAHRCPGMYVALQETDIFLSVLFADDRVRMIGHPTVTYNDAFGAFEVHGLIVAVC